MHVDRCDILKETIFGGMTAHSWQWENKKVYWLTIIKSPKVSKGSLGLIFGHLNDLRVPLRLSDTRDVAEIKQAKLIFWHD